MYSKILIWFIWANLASTLAVHGATQFKIATSEAGIYRLDYADLREAGLAEEHWRCDEIGISHRGIAIPIWVEDDGNGQFGEGDWIEFRAEILRGEQAYYHEYATHNVYVLEMKADAPRRMVPKIAAADWSEGKTVWRGTLRKEVDTLLMRFESFDYQPHEIWYWRKLACNDKLPYVDRFLGDDFDFSSGGTVDLKIYLRGWSSIPNNDQPDHAVAVWMNSKKVKEDTWDGKEDHEITVADLPIHLFKAGYNELMVAVKRRKESGTDRLAVDVCVLNAYALDFPQTDLVPDSKQTYFSPRDSLSSGASWFVRAPGEGLVLYGDQGSRVIPQVQKGTQDVTHWRIPVETGDTGLTAVPKSCFYRPVDVRPFKPGDLRSTAQQADYVMIVHPRLMDAIETLADFHSRRGLRVKIVDVMSVYDTFNDGIFHPKAIREFLRYAFENWEPPAPRFVLLVGDASWDTKNLSARNDLYPAHQNPEGQSTRMSFVPGTPYADGYQNTRNLVPTWTYFSRSGHAASDNAFACVTGDDFKPDLAIGRFPVVTPDDVRAIVKKTIDYIESPKVGPWRRNILWITNEQKWAQKRVDRLALELADLGYAASKIFPSSRNQSNVEDTKKIGRALDEGQYLVYFYGHGGRFIWRTGPPDPLKNHDLFTLDDVDRLQPNTRIPILLSFTCYSAPFDHPSADSIGERFLRLPDKGAVAVVGASWRNSPNEKMNRVFLERLSRKGTVGEALMLAKYELVSRDLVETYNLLGDPAIPLDPPEMNVELTLKKDKKLVGKINVPRFSGNTRIDALGTDGNVLWTNTFKTRRKKFKIDLSKIVHEFSEIRYLSCYMWDTERNLDGVGVIDVSSLTIETQSPTPGLHQTQ